MVTNFIACSNDAEEALVSDIEIRLTSEIVPSRVTALDYQSTQIAVGQEVGVTIIGAQSVHQNVAWSVGQDGVLTNIGSPVFWGDSQITVTAYHPYHSAWTGTEQEFSVSTDQSTNSGYSNSDLLWTTTSASMTDATIGLNFKHLLTKINVTLSSDHIDDLSGTTISICGTKISTIFNPMTGVVSGASDVQEIMASITTDEAYTASAIIVPQAIVKNTKFIKLTRGDKNFHYTLPEDMQYLPGYSYHYTLKVEESNMEDLLEGKEIEW